MQISAFVDGELPENESELLLRRLCQDPTLRAQVDAYLAIGRSIRGDTEVAGMALLRSNIADQLGEHVVPNRAAIDESSGSLLRPIAGVAVAASVAVIALVGLRQLETPGDAPAGVLEDLSAVAIDGGPSYTEPPVSDSMSDRPSDMLTLYYLRHGQQAPNLGSRLVGLEVRQDQIGRSDAIADSADAEPDSPAEPASEPAREESDTEQ